MLVFCLSEDAAQLVEETEELCRKSQKMLQEYRNHSKGHLLDAVDSNVLKLTNETERFKSLAFDSHSSEQTKLIAQFNSSFQFLSNQIEREFDIVAEMYGYTVSEMTTSEMEKLTKQLMEKLENTLKKLCQNKSESTNLCWEFQRENLQLMQFSNFMKSVNKQLEETLIRHNKSVNNLEGYLLTKINNLK